MVVRRRVCLLFLSLLVMSACVSPHTPALARRAWSDHPLVWSEYHAVAPMTDPASAATVVALSWRLRCDDERPSFHVVATFFPDASWVRTGVLLDAGPTARSLLYHERTHFDLTEVVARTMRQYFSTATCTQGGPALIAISQAFDAADRQLQRAYDEQTDNGREPIAEGRWEDRIAAALHGLDAYAYRADVETSYDFR